MLNPPVAAHSIEFNDTKPALQRNDASPRAFDPIRTRAWPWENVYEINTFLERNCRTLALAPPNRQEALGSSSA